MIGQFKNKRIKIQISQFAKSTKIKVSKIIKLQLKKTWGCHGDGLPGTIKLHHVIMRGLFTNKNHMFVKDFYVIVIIANIEVI